MQIQKCKGCRDLTALDMNRFNQVEDTFRRTCRQWGYDEIRTPTIEYLHLFTSAGTLTPGMLKRVYSFLDWDGWSGERVVLKPDATIPAARLYIEQLTTRKLARLFYVTNTFIFEETGVNSRERWQCGAELIGSGTPLADAELVALSLDALRGCGLQDVTIQISHAGIIRDLLSSLALAPSEQSSIFDEILDGNLTSVAELKASPETAEVLNLLFSIKGRAPGFLKNIRAMYGSRLPHFQATLDSFIATLDAVDRLGVDYRIDLTAGKGFEYYTGFIFRLYAGEVNVGGGGRYDQLIAMMGGPATPAAGFALYMDRLMARALSQPRSSPARIGVRTQPDELQAALDLVHSLHDEGFIAQLMLETDMPAGCAWLVEITSANGFILTETSTKQAFSCAKLPEVLARLGAG